jgi:catechol 2,3-dioxygenase-like lactoylglutathione lyase family enzyme
MDGEPVVDQWATSVGAITLFVEDLDEARRFYQQVFDLPTIFEDEHSAVFRFGGTVVNLLRTTAADELVAPAPVGAPDAGARAVYSVEVDDVDALVAQLAERGVALLNGPMDRPWGIRTASFRDPGGHIWEIGQPIRQ